MGTAERKNQTNKKTFTRLFAGSHHFWSQHPPKKIMINPGSGIPSFMDALLFATVLQTGNNGRFLQANPQPSPLRNPACCSRAKVSAKAKVPPTASSRTSTRRFQKLCRRFFLDRAAEKLATQKTPLAETKKGMVTKQETGGRSEMPIPHLAPKTLAQGVYPPEPWNSPCWKKKGM